MATSGTFTLFSSFPTEIRLVIWHFALPSHRLINLKKSSYRIDLPPNTLQSVCHESKAILEQTFTRMFYRYYPDRPFYIDTETDAFEYFFLACNSEDSKAEVLTCDPQEKRQVKRVWLDSPVIDLRKWVMALYKNIITAHPQVEELLVILLKSEDEHNILASEREDFLKHLKIRTGLDYWDEEGDFLGNIRSRCIERFGVWRMPRVMFDVGDMVVDRDVDEKRRGWDMTLVTGAPDKKMAKRWM